MAGLAFFCFLLVTGRSSGAGTCTVAWTGRGGDTSWTNGKNWSSGVAPGPTDYACADAQTASQIDVGADVTVLGFNVQVPLTISSGTFTITDTTQSSDASNLTLSGGTLTGDASLTVANFTWSGGTLAGNGSTTVPSGGSFTLSGDNTRFLTTRTFENAGQGVSTGAGTVYFTGATFKNSGRLELESDRCFCFYTGEVGTVANSGTLVRSQSSGTATIGVRYSNGGSTLLLSGTLNLSNGGGASGSFSMDGGSLQFSGGTYDLANGSTVNGNVRVTGGTVGVSGSYTAVTSVSGGEFDANVGIQLQTLTETGGVIGGAGAIQVGGTFTWTAGNQEGSGSTTVAKTGTFVLNGDNTRFISARTVENAGSGTATGGGAVYFTGGTFTNSGTLDLQSDRCFCYYTGSAGNFANSGTLLRSTSTGQVTVGTNVAFANSGAVSVASGKLSLQGGGTSSGSFTTNGGILNFGGGTAILTASSTVSSTAGGVEILSGAVVEVNGTYGAASTVLDGGTLNINSAATMTALDERAGTLGGPGTVTITSTFKWSGGNQSGTGTTLLQRGGTFSLESDYTRFIDTRTVENAGTGIETGSGTVYFTGGTFKNSGTLDLQGTGCLCYYTGASGTVANTGSLTRTTSTGTVRVGSNVAFANSGSTDVASGTLTLLGGGTSSGSFTTSGGTLELGGGNFTLTEMSSVSSTNGQILLSGATVDLNGAYGAATTIMTGGTLNVNSAATMTALTQQNGTLSGGGTVTITNAFTWLAGAQSGTGTTLLQDGGTFALTSDSTRFLDARTVQNDGTGASTGTGTVYLANGGKFVNGGSLDLQSDRCFCYYTGAAGTVTNTGSITRTVSTGAVAIGSNVAFDNDGTVDVATGVLRLNGGGTSNGDFNTSGGELEFSGGTSTLGPTSTVTSNGGGDVRVDGATVDVNGGYGAANTILTSGTLAMNSNAAMNSLDQQGGTLTGSGLVGIIDSFSWSGGSQEGTGTTDLAQGGTFTLSGDSTHFVNSRTVENDGTGVSTGTGVVYFVGGQLLNTGTLELKSARCFCYYTGSAGTVGNLGDLNATAAGVNTIGSNVAFTNYGHLTVSGGGTFAIAGGGSANGSFSAGSGTIRWVSGDYTLSTNSSVDGTAEVSGGTVASDGVWSAATRIDGGTLALSQTLHLPSLVETSGALAGSGAITVDTFHWSGGSQSGTGSTFVPAGGTFTLDTNNTRFIDTRYVQNDGNGVSTGDGVVYFIGGTFVNGGTLDLQSNRCFCYYTGGAGTFTNTGTLVRSTSTGTAVIGSNVSFENDATVDLRTGILQASSFVQPGGATLKVRIAGTEPGTGYARLRVDANANLGGTLQTVTDPGFTPPGGSTYDVLDFGSRTGSFDTIDAPGYSPHYNANNLTLTRAATVVEHVQSSPDSGVTIDVSPADNNGTTSQATPFDLTYDAGTAVTFTAPSTFGNETFAEWDEDGQQVSTNPQFQTTLDGTSHTFTAVYNVPIVTHTLSVSSLNPESGVGVTVTPPDRAKAGNGSTPFQRSYNDGTVVTLTAQDPSATGSRFDHWEEDGQVVQNGNDPQVDVTMGTDHALKAVYVTPVQHPSNGRIAFQTNRSGSSDAYTMNPDGSVLENLTNNPLPDYEPSFSPDASQVVFTRDTQGSNWFDIFVMNPDGSNQHDITNNSAYDADPAWSPDGSQIAFIRGLGNNQLWVMNADGSNQHALVTAGFAGFPSWSPDGTTIAFHYNPSGYGNFNIWTIRRDGSKLTQLTTDSLDTLPKWSPDGSKILFTSQRTGHQELWVMNADGSAQTRLTSDSATNDFPGWSPDGTKIVFSRGNDILTMNADGSGEQTIRSDGFQNGAPTWSSAPLQAPPTVTHSLDVGSRNPSSGVYVSVSPVDNQDESNGTTSFSRTYDEGTVVTLTAPSSLEGGNTFNHWEVDGTSATTSQSLELTMDADHVATAVYTQYYSLFVRSQNPDSGVPISVTPSDRFERSDGTTPFDRRYASGTDVHLTAPETANGNVFKYWEIDDGDGFTTDSSPSTEVAMTFSRTVTAVYGPPTTESPPEVSKLAIDDASVTEPDDGETASAVFNVHLTPSSIAPVTVSYSTSPITATSSRDYTSTCGRLAFEPGETEKAIVVPIIGDNLNEDDETFAVTLSDAVGATVERGSATGTIVNNDPEPTLTIGDIAVSEGDSGETIATFDATLSAPSGRGIGFDWTTADGTASSSADYQPEHGTVYFDPGELKKTVSVPVNTNTKQDGNRTFFIRITSATHVQMTRNEAKATILDDDGPPPPVFRQAIDAGPVSGTVLVRLPGTTQFIPLTEGEQFPIGTTIDARKGRVTITISDGAGGTQFADFYEGIFTITQQTADGVLVLKLEGGDFSICAARSLAAADKPPGKTVRHLWGSGKGKFRTSGKYSSATVRGTIWLTDDRCDGTNTFVQEGIVTVLDFGLNKTVFVSAGQSYLAKAPVLKPKQTQRKPKKKKPKKKPKKR